MYVFCFPCARVYVCIFAFPNLRRTLESTSGSVSPPFSRSESLTTSLLNHPLISSTSFDVSRKFEQINIRTVHNIHSLPATPDWIWELAIADQNSNFMDEIWNYLSWHCVYFDFKRALIGFCVWGTSEVINYHSLSALVKATAAFHRGLAGSFVYKEGDRNRPLRLGVMCFSQTAISSESWSDSEKGDNECWRSTWLINNYFSFFGNSVLSDS